MPKSPIQALEKLKASKKPAKPQPQQLSLELWPDSVRGVPNAVLRGSLFSVSRTRTTAKKRELLAAVEGIEIRFKGERFNQTDLDLWEMLLHLARLQPLGDRVEFSAYSLLKELGRGVSGREHEELKEDISRLLGGVVEITWTDTQKTFIGHLVQQAYRDEKTQRYVVIFDQKMLGLYEGGYSYIDWDRRKALKSNSLAKWLQGFYGSHAQPYAYKVETLKNLCGSTIGRLTDFRKLLRSALNELVTVGSIKSWKIENDLVHVVNVPTKSQLKHIRNASK
jgi:hypothetical protein